MTSEHHILRVSCCDKPGIVAAVATTLSNNQCNIEESSQFNDALSGQFFMRVVFSCAQNVCATSFEERFAEIAATFDMTWDIRPVDAPIKTLIMVSKEDHCLNDLLYRHRTSNLNIDIVGVVSNHEDARELVESRGLSFHHLPITKDNKAAQETALRGIIEQTDAEIIVLARYMQILSDTFCQDFSGRVINIHHSFLPGFKGANPYKQAYERGVKIIGATAHFVTADLDEGPIIEQETVRVTHAHTPQKMRDLGRDTEARVLSHAIRHYTEHRVFLQGNRTVILS